jgi:SWI/SNF-related matrix-associated actin-dependent regulator of chromatin subfamily A3
MMDVVEPAPPTELTQAPPKYECGGNEANEIREGSSAKIDQLVKLLELIPSNEKSLVFSQFTSFLDKVCLRYISIRDKIYLCYMRR